MQSVQNFEIYCAGKFINTAKTLRVSNPYNGSLVAETSLAGEPELEIAITAAIQMAGELERMPSYKRYSILMQISDYLHELRQQLGELITLESGKPIRYALAEVDRSVQTFAVAAEESRRLPSEYFSIDWTPAGTGKEGFVKYFPIGLVAGISPFNFPLNLAVHKIAPAIAAGCPIDPSIRGSILVHPPKLFVSGHSHILKVKYDKTLGMLHINPGAAGVYGFHKVRTMVRFVIDNGEFKDLEVIELAG